MSETEALIIKADFMIQIKDLTKKLEYEIRKREEVEERFHALVENSTDFIYTLDLEGNFTSVNKAAEDLTGYTKAELMNMNFRDYTSNDIHEKIYQAFHSILSDGKPLKNFPLKVFVKDGTEKYFETSVGLMKKGDKITGFQGSSRDVTQRIKTLKALEESENRNRMLIENMRDGLGVQDENGILTFVNDSFCRMIGYSKEDLIGYPVQMLHDEKSRNRFNEKITQRRKGVSETYEIEYKSKEGNIIPTIVSAQPIFSADGQYKGSFAVITDTSEIKQAENERRAIESQLLQSDKLASIGQLAAGIAHEINNPTGFVSSNLSTLSDYMKDIHGLIVEYRRLITALGGDKDHGESSHYSGFIERIKALEKESDINFILNDISHLIAESYEGTDKIKKIIQDLKDFAHPGEDKLKYADINKNLDSTLNVVWNELKYKAKVIKDYGDLPDVKCYPQQLNQVFANLLVNAAQAIERQGEIKIITHSVNEHVEVFISDTGSGIPPENLPKIFDPFYTTKEVGKGTGLGLNVSYNIIKKHGGTIDVESTVGAGTTFKICIPVKGIDKQ